MRSILLVFTAGLIAVGALIAAHATSPAHVAKTAAVGGDKALGRNIRDYLMSNPEILVEAMQELERKQDSARDTMAQKGITEHEKELLGDPESPVTGNPNGNVTVVEFSDYQCPYCKRSYGAIKAVLAKDGNVKLILKDLPILGEASRIASLAVLASRKQHKYEPFHNALMEFGGKLDRDRIMQLASSVGIDTQQLQKDMEDPKLKEILDHNMALATALGVRGTPAFVIGKQFVPGAVDADQLKQLIDDARKG